MKGFYVWLSRRWTLLRPVVLCLLAAAAVASEGQRSTPQVRSASAIAFDGAGNLYIADASGNQVLEATLGGALVVVAGTGVQGFAGDGSSAASAQLNQPRGLAFGADGTLYIADSGNERVRAVDSVGVITTLAGSGAAGFRGDGGSASAAALREPTAVAVDGSGGVLVCDRGNQRVRRVLSGTITTLAGTGVQGYSGDGGSAQSAQLDTPSGVTVAGDGRVFIADTHNQRVRVVGTDGSIQTFAGTGVRGFAGDGGAAVAARLSDPYGLGWAADGSLLIADAGNERVRKVSAAGVITTWSGSGTEGTSKDGDPGTGAVLRSPRAVAVSAFNLPVLADTLNGTVRELVSGDQLFQPAALAYGRASVVSIIGPATQVYGQTTFRVNVTGAVASPFGKVLVLEGTGEAGKGVVTAGQSQLSLLALSAGQHSLVASYTGDGLNPSASSSPVSITVEPATLTATASSTTASYGSPLSSLSGVLSGVLPQDEGEVDAVFLPSATALPDVGVYPITATLSGSRSANYSVSMASDSGALTVVRAGTAVSLGSTAPGYVGVPLALTATVAPAGEGQPSGSVQFIDGGAVIATVALAGGVARTTYPAPSVGSRNLSVAYLGDHDFLPATSPPEMVSVLPLPDFTVASSGAGSANTSAGGTASYQVVVSSASGPFTGAVSFSATGLPSGAIVAFSPPQVVPAAAPATVNVSVLLPAASASLRPGTSNRSNGAAIWLAALACCPALCARGRRRLTFVMSMSTMLLLVTGCGARTVGEGNGGVLAQTYSLQIAGASTNLAGAVVVHSTTLTLTVQQ